MDVALDANIILNDPRMQGNAFHNLLAYLKKKRFETGLVEDSLR
jgi:hypothetical protein